MTPRVAWMLVILSLLGMGRPSPTHAQPGAQKEGQALCAPSADCPVLRLDALLKQVLQAHPEVQSLRLEDDRAAAALQNARGGFDPTLVSGYEYKTQADKAKLNVLRTGIDVPVNVPLSPSLIVDYRRGLGSSIDPSVATSLDGETSVGVELEPLSGLFLDKDQATLDKARLEPRRVDAVQAQARNRLLLEATLAYWKWVEAVRKREVSRNQLEIAVQRRTLVSRRVRSGEAAAIDSTEAKLAVADRREQVAAAEQTAQQAGVKLATYLWTANGQPADLAFQPPSSVDVPTLGGVEAAPATETAYARRPELRRLAVKRQQTQIEQRLARGQQRPDLKLKAQAVSYSADPLAVSDIKVGFEIRQPLFFRSGRSRVETARVDAQQVDLKEQITRRKIRADVEAAIVDWQQAQERVAAAAERVDLARRLQDAERQRFQIGESTLFLLNKREQDFAKARKSLVEARADAARADARYRWATGTISDDLSTSGRVGN